MKLSLSIAIASLFCATTIFAEGVNSQTRRLSLEERDAKRLKVRAIMEQKVGGFINRPGTPQGEIFYVNCQKIVPKEWIEESIRYFEQETKFKISYVEGVFDFPVTKIYGNASLFIIDDKAMPPILVAPENSWAYLNIASLTEEKRPAFFEMRTKKQLSRVFALLCGASNSQYPRALTRGIIDKKELDKNPDIRLPVDVLSRFKTYMESLGVKPCISIPYRRAVEEGWAPQPTNEYQKAVWDKVHAAPKNPMKIEFDPKKGR